MKEISRKIIAVIITCCIVITGIYEISELTRLKKSTIRDLSYQTYFNNSDEYDVLFFGTSHTMDGVNPLTIWNESGITSYNFGSPICTLPMTYWKLKCILNQCNVQPRLVVVDCYGAFWGEKGYNVERMHQAFDAFPLSLIKYNAICDLMDAKDIFSAKDKFNMMFLLGAYHTRWDELSKIDFVNEYIDTKGCEVETNVAIPVDISDTLDMLEITNDMTGVIYLKKIIEECRYNDIDILLTYYPFPTEEVYKKEANMIKSIASELDVNYIDFTSIDIVNYDLDCSDVNSHLNYAGQVKVSRYLGKYISEHYRIKDRQDDLAVFRSWEDAYRRYIDDSCERLKSSDDVLSYLMLCYELPLDIIFDFNDSEILKSEVFLGLLKQLGVDSDEIGECTDFIIIKNGKGYVLNNFRSDGNFLFTETGAFRLEESNADEGEYKGIYFDDCEIYKLSDYDYDMTISVVRDGELFDNIYLNYYLDDDLHVHTLQLDRES